MAVRRTPSQAAASHHMHHPTAASHSFRPVNAQCCDDCPPSFNAATPLLRKHNSGITWQPCGQQSNLLRDPEASSDTSRVDQLILHLAASSSMLGQSRQLHAATVTLAKSCWWEHPYTLLASLNDLHVKLHTSEPLSPLSWWPGCLEVYGSTEVAVQSGNAWFQTAWHTIQTCQM
jgi:hypothetical protein